MVVTVSFKAGDHVPVMLLMDVVGKGVNVVPAHIGPTAGNVGVVFWFTVTVNVAVFAH